MSDGNYTNYLIVSVPGPLPKEWETRLVHAAIEDSSNLPAAATLRYRDHKSQLLGKLSITIGSRLTAAVRAGDTTSPVPLFTGEVVTLETEFDGTGTFTTIRALDMSHRLMRGRQVATYTGKASDIARDVARKAGLPIGKIDPTSTVYEMVTQPNTTDWEFLKMLAADNDAEVAMVDGTFVFRKPVRAATAPGTGTPARQSDVVVQMNENLLAVRSTVTSVGQLSRVEVRGWDVRRKKDLVSEVKADTSAELQLGLTPAQVARPFGDAELLVTDVPYRTAAEVKAVATALASDVASAFAELEVGIRGNPRMRAGVPITLADVGPPFEGKYTITSSRHVFGPGRFYETWLTVSGRQDRSPYGLAAGASAPARGMRVPGLAIGIVTNTSAGQGRDRDHPERCDQGWVKLRFPWLTGLGDSRKKGYETDWVRTVQFGGVHGGGVFSPEINDEVLVGFEQGLLDRPYVIGGLYNGVDKPSPHDGPLIDPRDGAVTRRSFASRTGHRLELLDPPLSSPSAVRGVRLRTGNNKLVIELDQQKTAVTINSDGTVAIEARRQVTIQGNGITLDAGAGELSLTGRSVSVQGRANVEVKAPIVRIN